MNNTETLVTSDTQETRQNKHYSKQKEQHRDTNNIDTQDKITTRVNRRNNTDKLTTSDTQDT
jgi:hypothetical protein